MITTGLVCGTVILAAIVLLLVLVSAVGRAAAQEQQHLETVAAPSGEVDYHIGADPEPAPGEYVSRRELCQKTSANYAELQRQVVISAAIERAERSGK